MPIRGILFDLDGTLIDQFEAIHRAFSRTLTHMGYPKPSYERVKSSVGGASLSTMTKLIGPERAQEAVGILRPIFEEEMLLGLKALPGSYEILSFCRERRIKAAVLTNKYGPHARVACEYLRFSKLLSFTLGADDTEWKKPDPRLTRHALEKLDRNPNETLYLGDSPYDYETATQAELKPILVSTGTHSREELEAIAPDCVHSNLDEVTKKVLPALIQRD